MLSNNLFETNGNALSMQTHGPRYWIKNKRTNFSIHLGYPHPETSTSGSVFDDNGVFVINTTSILKISTKWIDAEILARYEPEIRESLQSYLVRNRADLKGIELHFCEAGYSDTLRNIIDFIIESSQLPHPVRVIRKHYKGNLVSVITPYLLPGNETIVGMARDVELLGLYDSIPDPLMFPRYITLNRTTTQEQARSFMEEIDSRVYGLRSNTKLVTSYNTNVNTVVIMQYMHAKQEYARLTGIALFMKHREKHDQPAPSDMTEVPEIDVAKVWKPHVTKYPDRNQSIWMYHGQGSITIDDVELVYSFPKIKMTMSTILDMMEDQVKPLEGISIKCKADFTLDVGHKNGPPEKQVDVLITSLNSLGYTHLEPNKNNEGTMVSVRKEIYKNRMKHTSDIHFDIGENNHVLATVAYQRIRYRTPTVNTGAHCAKCMKPVLLEYISI